MDKTNNIKLDKNRILAMKANASAKYRQSHCDLCACEVGVKDTVSVPTPGFVRCKTCTRSEPDFALDWPADESPTTRYSRKPTVPAPCGRVST
jgi:hypothetical protein